MFYILVKIHTSLYVFKKTYETFNIVLNILSNHIRHNNISRLVNFSIMICKSWTWYVKLNGLTLKYICNQRVLVHVTGIYFLCTLIRFTKKRNNIIVLKSCTQLTLVSIDPNGCICRIPWQRSPQKGFIYAMHVRTRNVSIIVTFSWNPICSKKVTVVWKTEYNIHNIILLLYKI